MFEHILVPTDFSEGSAHALRIASNVSNDKGSVTLIHVIETIPGESFDEFKDFYAKLEERAWNAMQELIGRCPESAVEIIPRIEYGGRVEQILKYASDHQVDLIVLNSHRIHPEDPVRDWGTISYKVGVLSQCPVMLVK
jgi:universal stress protein A